MRKGNKWIFFFSELAYSTGTSYPITLFLTNSCIIKFVSFFEVLKNNSLHWDWSEPILLMIITHFRGLKHFCISLLHCETLKVPINKVVLTACHSWYVGISWIIPTWRYIRKKKLSSFDLSEIEQFYLPVFLFF